MMTRICAMQCAVALLLAPALPAALDAFGTGEHVFTLDFVRIDGGESQDFRIGVYQITNAQWAAFEAETGRHFRTSYWGGDAVPVNHKSWYAAAHFVNWLNTSHNYAPAYKFTGTTFGLWSPDQAADGTNLYRHKDAFYFLPTEAQWVQAAYWNGTNTQTWATPHDGEPVAEVDANFNQWPYTGPWPVGSGSMELNGTFDMMGNVFEWLECPFSGVYSTGDDRVLRGGAYLYPAGVMRSSTRVADAPGVESNIIGFRVASHVPEPTGLALLTTGAVLLRRWRRR